MTMKNDAKFKEQLICRFKIDMKILINFEASTRKPQKCNDILLTKLYNV